MQCGRRTDFEFQEERNVDTRSQDLIRAFQLHFLSDADKERTLQFGLALFIYYDTGVM
jgi:hypothetical protein